MANYLSGSQFALKAAIRVGLFAALTLGFPFIVYGLIVATNARSVSGASGALAVVAGIYLKPLIIIAFLLFLIGPCWRRMRSLGLPGYVGLLAPLLFLADAPFLMMLGTHWGVAFSLGILHLNTPLFALSGLLLLVAMSLATPPDAADPNGRARFGIPGIVAAVVTGALVMVVLSVALLSGWSLLLVMTKQTPADLRAHLMMLARISNVLLLVKPYLCIAFNAALVLLVVLSRRNASGSGDVRDDPPPTPKSPIQPGRAVFGQR